MKKSKTFRAVLIVTLTVVGLMLLYMLFTFFTHGDPSLTGTYNTAWLTQNMTVDGGYYETAPKGSLDAIRAAAEVDANVKLNVTLSEGELFLDYGENVKLADALAITEENRTGVIVEVDGKDAAEAFVALLQKLDYRNGNVAVQSKDVTALSYLKNNCPTLLRGLVTGDLTDTDLNGFEGFLHRNMFYNFRARPHYVVYDDDHLPCVAASLIRKGDILVLADADELTHEKIASLGEITDGLILSDLTIKQESIT